MTKNCFKLGLACFFSFMLLGNSTLFGQRKLQVGIGFGPLVTNFVYKDKSNVSETKLGIMVELLAAYHLSDHFSLTSGIGYVFRNQQVTIENQEYYPVTGNYATTYFRTEDVIQQSAHIPIYLKYHLTSTAKGLFFSAGLLPTMGFQSNTKFFTAYPYHQTTDQNEVNSNEKFFQLNSLASLGYRLQGQTNLGISFELYGGMQLAGRMYYNGRMVNAGLRIGIWF